MDIVYYSDDGDCPVKEYFNQLRGRIKLLADIDSKLVYVKDNRFSPLLSSLHGHKFFEVKQRKNEKIVIRILVYFYKDRMVLLSAFEKPDSYKETRARRDIEENYKKADIYLNKFLSNPNKYENYN